jgi:hypothetical protein
VVTPWVAAALQRLNLERDPWILLALAEAGVLTTSQIRRLHFRSIEPCRRRLRELRALRLVTGFRPGGSRDAETVWAITGRGARLLEELLGETVRAGAWGRGEASARALPHRRAVSEFFMALVGAESGPRLLPVRAAGHHALRAAAPGEVSTLWLGERGCRTVFGDPARRPLGVRAALVPDGAALVSLEERSAPIVLEMDRGTESLQVLGEKLARYATLRGLAVLVCFTDPARASWRPPDLGVDVLVSDLGSHLAQPWGRIWAGRDGHRLALGDALEPVQ